MARVSKTSSRRQPAGPRAALRSRAPGASGMLELRFMAANADIQGNDRLVTSGVDGTYPPGLPVATVMRIEKDAEKIDQVVGLLDELRDAFAQIDPDAGAAA